MAKFYKNYDEDFRRRLLQQWRKGMGDDGLRAPNLLDDVFIDGGATSREVRFNSDGELEARYYRPKEAEATVRTPKLIPDPVTGEDTLTYDESDFSEVSPDNARPAGLTVMPTTTTNYQRPYTIAAGWERYPQQSGPRDTNLGTLTVLFRDGTLWNYYDVDRAFWIKFKGSISKGEFINRHSPSPELTRKYRNGPADLSGVSSSTRDLIYTVSRAAQYRFASNKSYTYTNKLTGETRRFAKGRVPKSAQGRARRSR
jgi:hypothetical protein